MPLVPAISDFASTHAARTDAIPEGENQKK